MAILQVMHVLRVVDSGSFMEVIGDTMDYDKSTVRRAVENVTNALHTKTDQFWKKPTQEEIKKNQRRASSRVVGFQESLGVSMVPMWENKHPQTTN